MVSLAAAAFVITNWRSTGSTWACEVLVPKDHPCFEGHFPNDRILPGIAHLQLLLEAATRASGVPQALKAVRGIRFRRVVRPGQRLELSASVDEGGVLRFELRGNGERFSNGVVELEEAAP